MKKRMALLDSGFLRMERRESPQHGSILLIFTIPENSPQDYMHRLAHGMRQRPVTAPRFNWVPSGDLIDQLAPAWKVLPAAQIDIDYHFRHSALPRPGGEHELGLVVSRLATHPLDLARPPWEIHLIEGLAGGRFAIFVKMHHSLIDGVSAAKMLRDWLSPDPRTIDTPALWAAEPVVTPAATPRRAGGSLFESIVTAARGSVATATAVGGAAAHTAAAAMGAGSPLVAPYTAPRSIFNRAITQRRRVSTQRFELSRARAIADRIGGTLNDAIAVVFAGALRRYLIELKALPDQSLVAGVLASLRGTVDKKTADNAGNVISFIFADLATDIDDIAERATRITASTRAGKRHLLGLKKDAMTYSSLMLAPFVLTTATGTGHLFPMFNVGLSNVPGVDAPLYWNGARAEALHATTIITNGQALVVTVTSWSGSLCFTFTACPDAVPHSQRLSTYLVDALEDVEEALI
jgi:diacylglycerol O-acyltransferase / wax synthase